MSVLKLKWFLTVLLSAFCFLGLNILFAQNATSDLNRNNGSTLSNEDPIHPPYPVDVKVLLEAVPLTRPNGSVVTLTPGNVFAFCLYEFSPSANSYNDPPQYGPLYRISSSNDQYPLFKISSKKLYWDRYRTKTHALIISPATEFKTGHNDIKLVRFSYSMDQLDFKEGANVVTSIPVTLYAVYHGRDIPVVDAVLQIGFVSGQSVAHHLQIKITPQRWIGP